MSKLEFLRTYFLLISNYNRNKKSEAERAAYRERDLLILMIEPGCPETLRNKLATIIYGADNGHSVSA